jgi:hypothetical protein
MRENESCFARQRAAPAGHAVDEGEVVVREVGSYHVVRKEAA